MPIEDPTDVAPSERTARMMHSGSHLLPAPPQVELTMAVLRRMQLMCAMRLQPRMYRCMNI